MRAIVVLSVLGMMYYLLVHDVPDTSREMLASLIGGGFMKILDWYTGNNPGRDHRRHTAARGCASRI